MTHKATKIFFLFLFFWMPFVSSYELGVVCMFQNEAPYIKEWIEYHRMIGVDHFWLYDDASTDEFQKVLQPYIQEGLVELLSWNALFANKNYPMPQGAFSAYVRRQCISYQDGLRRAKANTEWVALIDMDEFVLPMKEKTVPECMKSHFSNASAVYANWRNFGTGGVHIPPGENFLFKLTACSLKHSPRNHVGKSIVRPSHINIDAVYHPHHFPIQTNGVYMNGNGGVIIPDDDTDLKTDGMHHDRFIRINHYVLRDEGYFRDVKLPRARQWYKDKELLLEHYENFSLMKDFTIIDFIRKKHPHMYEKFWANNQ